MSLRDELNADLGKAISLYEQSFQWDGGTYVCVRRSMPAGYEFQDGGEVHKIAEMITVQRSLFTDGIPEVGDGIDDDVAQIKSIDPNTENLILLIGSFDED